ncbi:MAG: respiratory chain complex I subunit 1 family protein [Ferrimicrobium sp.]
MGALGPTLIGVVRQVRSRLEGRRGPGLWQPWRDLMRLWKKETLEPVGRSPIFVVAPYVLAGTTASIVVVGPYLATTNPLSFSSDLFVVVGLLFLGNIFIALAGLDLGTAFGGMGASRELTVSSLVEPTILVSIFALSIPARSSSLGTIADISLRHPDQILTPAALLALAAFAVVVIAETKRLPVDNPSTHLELTMIHEAMLLEYSGPRLAVIEWASSVRFALLLGLLSNLFIPIGLWTPGRPAWEVGISLMAIVAKTLIISVIIATIEIALAKMRLFQVPELLSGSFVLALLSIVSSYFLTPGR